MLVQGVKGVVVCTLGARVSKMTNLCTSACSICPVDSGDSASSELCLRKGAAACGAKLVEHGADMEWVYIRDVSME